MNQHCPCPDGLPPQSPTTSSTSRPLTWMPSSTSPSSHCPSSSFSASSSSGRGSWQSNVSSNINSAPKSVRREAGSNHNSSRLRPIGRAEGEGAGRQRPMAGVGVERRKNGARAASSSSSSKVRSKTKVLRQIPGTRSGAAEWLFRRYRGGGEDDEEEEEKRRRRKRRKAKERENRPTDLDEGLEEDEEAMREHWQSLAQIVHLRARRRHPLTESQQSSMESQEEEKPGCTEAFCGKRMKEWAFWFIVAFLAGLTVKDLYNLINEYMENPKKSDMNVRFNETMRMPNITFCMDRAQAWSHFKLNGSENGERWDAGIREQLRNMSTKETFLKGQWEFGMVMETYNLIATMTSMERETTAHGTVNSIDKFRNQERLADIRKLSTFWLAELAKRGVTFEEFVQKVGKETLRRSMQRFQRTTFDEDLIIKTQLTITWLSQMQLCFQPTFDEQYLKPIVDQGEFFVMVLSHNAEKLDGQQVDCMSADFHGRPSSSSRFMGSKGVMKDGFTDELCIGMMHETTVELKARYKMLPNEEEGTACQNNEDEEGEDNEWNCYLRCRMEFIRELCNCTAPTLSFLATQKGEDELEKWPLCNYAECKVDVQGRNYSDEDCTKKCHRNCDQIRYNIDHEKKGRSARPDFTTVVLKWGSFEYLTLEQDWVWTPTTFIAAIGGSIGMWLGLSILSLIQGSTYLITYVEHKVVEKRKQRSASITEEPQQQQQQPNNMKLSRVHPKLSKIHIDDEDKLATNPFASPFKKMSHVGPPTLDEQ